MFQIYCQLELTDLEDIIVWICLGALPVFFTLVYIGGGILYSAGGNFIKVFVVNSVMLYIILAVNLTFIFIPFDEFVDNYILLGSIGVCSYLLALIMYLKFLGGPDTVVHHRPKKAPKVISA
ncbi:hypothetical protein DJ568_08075 [Mucilaginibacter hurinus]|uniref:Uncharacterized protein n=1 Tax=Mucilaginibacter hurinus TaxID=2201324 RepID=A0A367GPY1_9SPHI|nr:hypothetical protein [Mucilaginibacter hurinus]RCH55138.1 hypothetical protein DJ568_08075 [Mucilaginibacter hurinus]